ncbi:MAG: hypothetical protein R3356_04060, partial [Eudoraea sp.]|nr:hypothetical protein [Eudoraea sp.]
MKRKFFIPVLMILILASCEKADQQPNIVFVFPDQYRRQAVGIMEQDPVLTPHIDRLATDGILFDN